MHLYKPTSARRRRRFRGYMRVHLRGYLHACRPRLQPAEQGSPRRLRRHQQGQVDQLKGGSCAQPPQLDVATANLNSSRACWLGIGNRAEKPYRAVILWRCLLH